MGHGSAVPVRVDVGEVALRLMLGDSRARLPCRRPSGHLYDECAWALALNAPHLFGEQVSISAR